jgi:hypothetical protein
MGPDKESWCKYHRISGHGTDSCVHLKQEIAKLLQNGKLRGYAKEVRGEDKKRTEQANKRDEEQRDMHTLHTISRGGESSTARKKYVRQVMLYEENTNKRQLKSQRFSLTRKISKA